MLIMSLLLLDNRISRFYLYRSLVILVRFFSNNFYLFTQNV